MISGEKMIEKDLIKIAKEQMKNSYSPYSKFSVGAALLCKDGKIFTGCNIENSSFSATICAERVAFSKAVSEGEKKFEKIAIVGGEKGVIENYCYPCGICRQFMSEFCEENFELIFINKDEKIESLYLKNLLPKSFKLER